MSHEHNWDREARRTPAAITVATLADSHGVSACIARWSWLGPRTISSLIRARQETDRAAQCILMSAPKISKSWTWSPR